jgi:hypothetical protein
MNQQNKLRRSIVKLQQNKITIKKSRSCGAPALVVYNNLRVTVLSRAIRERFRVAVYWREMFGDEGSAHHLGHAQQAMIARTDLGNPHILS